MRDGFFQPACGSSVTERNTFGFNAQNLFFDILFCNFCLSGVSKAILDGGGPTVQWECEEIGM